MISKTSTSTMLVMLLVAIFHRSANAGNVGTATAAEQRASNTIVLHGGLRHQLRRLDEEDETTDSTTTDEDTASTNTTTTTNSTNTTGTDPPSTVTGGGGRTRTDLIPLSPFDVQIAFAGVDDDTVDETTTPSSFTADAINIDTVSNAITDWMLASFVSKVPSSGVDNTTMFDTLTLQVADTTMQMSAATGRKIFLYTAFMDGVSIWDRPQTTEAVNPETVELIQRATFLEDNDLLTLLLDAGMDVYTLGEDGTSDASSSLEIIDVRAFVAPPRDDPSSNSAGNTQSSDSNNDTLELIIIIAIVIACLAFALLVWAVVWAWRSERKGDEKRSTSSRPSGTQAKSSSVRESENRKKSSGGTNPFDESDVDNTAAVTAGGRKSLFGRGSKSKSKTDNKTTESMKPPSEPTSKSPVQPSAEIGNSLEQPSVNRYGAGDSVISDDINTSLTAYYKAGVPGYASGTRQRGYDDGASMSSMDSYGYSLDGYAPSLGTAQAGYPVGPLHAAGQAQIKVGDEADAQPTAPAEEEVEDF